MSTTAAERIKLAIGDKEKGFKGPKREPLIVALCPLDIIEACEAAKEKTDIIEHHLAAANSIKGHPITNILVDDAYHIVEQASG